ncbi:PLP-dependent aminotransferase family protein [Yinghuangia sp. YIM S09857]|uniref:aminotransferase-like domain-containing protein n=1 Tax=Yinghuangia sp. YIM S09857 TaxID=3436929 RepID=UPI003F534B99
MDVERFAMLVGERLRRPRRNERRSRGERLADALASLVRSGDLLADTRLPSERALGAALGMSRGTVASALDQLAADGLVERRHGSGTYVRSDAVGGSPTGSSASDDAPAVAPSGGSTGGSTGGSSDAAAGAPEPIFSRWIREGTVVVDLAKSVVPDASLLPRLDLTVEDLLDVHPADGYGLLGETRLRELLAEGTAPPGYGPDRLLVVAGAQQALHLTADTLLAPGDRVLVEQVTYPGLLAAVERFGGVPVIVPGDRYGWSPDAFADAVERHRPAYAFTMPVHNPTGTVAADRRVRAVAAVARETGTLLVEDRSLADLVLTEGPPPHVPSAAAYAPEHTVCLGSLSKSIWGGLRVGWIAAHEPVFARFVQAKRRTDLATSALDQRLAVALLADPGAAARRDAWRRDLRVRRDHLSARLAAELPDWSWSRPAGGMSLWVRLPGADGEAFADTARRHGVAVSPGAVFGPPGGTAAADRIRLSFGWPEPVLSEGVDMLATAWAEHRARRR